MVSATRSEANTASPGRPMSRSIETTCATWRSRLWMPISTSTRRSRTRMESMKEEIIESRDDADRADCACRVLPWVGFLRHPGQQADGIARPAQLWLEKTRGDQRSAHPGQGGRGAGADP